jgi:Acetyl esterase (deacetylase)
MNITHDFPFDPTNGLSREELLKLAPPPEPAGYKAFWQETYSLVMAHKPYYHIEREIWSELPGCRVYILRAKTWDNREIGMWISRPAESDGGILLGQGYGNPATPGSLPRFTVCYPCMRGLGLSQCKDIPWIPSKHILHGIASRETYILRGVVSDLWLAATVMTDMFPDTAEHLNYMGSSMGGGMGALMLPWDSRFHAAYLQVPTFGGNPERLKYQSAGSGEAVRNYVQDHPEALEVLAWHDAAASAKYLRIPTIVVPALFDPSVAPAGQFSVANAIPEEYKKVFIAETGHFPRTEGDQEIYQASETLRDELFRKGCF